MLISLVLVIIVTAGGLAVSYLFDDDAPFLWRLSAGSIIGSAIFGTVAFLLAMAVGLNVGSVVAATIITGAPVTLFYRDRYRRRFAQDRMLARDRLQGTSRRKFLRLAYYSFFFLLFFFYFDRAMLESAAGIYTGGSQNLGDLPFHLGAIFSFTDANNFPPENPSFAGARFSYPFVADLVTACAVKLGASARDAMFVQNVAWAFALLVILERFVFQLTRDRLAARLAPALLFFSGGLGFVWAFGDYWSGTKGIFDFLNALPKDYTISDQFRWGNSMVVLFMTQRSLLLGMPLTLIVLTWLWKRFATEHTENDKDVPASPRLSFSASPILVGLLAGLLPLVHLHSLAVLFVVGAVVLILQPEKWLTWTLFAAGVAVIAIPELIWSVSGSASETTKFYAWHFGWDRGETNFVWFWFKNTGLLIPILLAGLYLAFSTKKRDAPDPSVADTKKKKKRSAAADRSHLTVQSSQLLWFYIPFALLFVVSNIAKLAPWEWDNIKVLIYWFVGSLPFIAFAIAWLWRRDGGWKILAGTCFVVLIASGALDVWRTVSGQINYKVFDKDAVEIAHQVKLRTPPDAVFLNAPTYNAAVVLTGRQSVMRYPGHLGSHGIDYAAREADVKRIYLGGPDAAGLIEKYEINYILVSPEERSSMTVNEQFFGRYPIVAESGQYRFYKIK